MHIYPVGLAHNTFDGLLKTGWRLVKINVRINPSRDMVLRVNLIHLPSEFNLILNTCITSNFYLLQNRLNGKKCLFNKGIFLIRAGHSVTSALKSGPVSVLLSF
jgi:hypothetical protein